MDFKKSDYKEYPKTLEPNDFWGQVRRTMMGKPITNHEVDCIIKSIVKELRLNTTDNFCDLACGNGALSAKLFGNILSYCGVDESEYLIQVAKQNFEIQPDYYFICDEVEKFVINCVDSEKYTKLMCYASIQYFRDEKLKHIFEELKSRFVNVERILIGNIPDRNKTSEFFKDAPVDESVLNDHTAQIGRWFSEDEIKQLAEEYGYVPEIFHLDESIFNSRYRFDAVFIRV